MQSTTSKEVNRAFILHPDEIRGVIRAIEERSGEANIEVECVGHLTLKPSSVEELLDIPNISDYKIKALKISNWGRLSASVSFTNGEDFNAPINVYISGDDKEVL